MHTYVVSYSFRGPGHEDGRATVKANDSAEAERIVINKYRNRDVCIVNVRQIN